MALQASKDAAEKAKKELSTVAQDGDQPAVHHAEAAGQSTSHDAVARPSWSSSPRT
jgi:hypothetical protein